MTKFRNAYSKAERVTFDTEGESMTQQHLAGDCDIKTIIRRYDKTGIIQNVAKGVARYGDYSEVNEYREALDLVNDATESFMTLPSEVRAHFDNDPGLFFETATDPNKIDVMRELGLAPPKVEAPAAKTKPKGEAKSEPIDSGDEA